MAPPPGPSGPGEVQAFVTRHKSHTGLMVPGASLNRLLPDLAGRFGTPDWYELGWGERDYYQSQRITSGQELKAMFWHSDAVLHVAALPTAFKDALPRRYLEPLCLSRAGFDTLLQFLAGSFALRDNHPVALSKGLYGDSQFYEATGRYHLLNTCNTWTARGLQSAGLSISPAFKLTADSVMDEFEDHPGSSCQ